MSSFTLYEIADRYQQCLSVYSALIDEHGYLAADGTLDSIIGEFSEKGLAVAAAIRNWESELDAVITARKSLQRREKSLEKKISGLREYLLWQMKRADQHEFRDARLIVRIKKNPPAVIVDNIDDIPECLKRTTTLITADKEELKWRMKNGEIIPGAHLEQAERLSIE